MSVHRPNGLLRLMARRGQKRVKGHALRGSYRHGGSTGRRSESEVNRADRKTKANVANHLVTSQVESQAQQMIRSPSAGLAVALPRFGPGPLRFMVVVEPGGVAVRPSYLVFAFSVGLLRSVTVPCPGVGQRHDPLNGKKTTIIRIKNKKSLSSKTNLTSARWRGRPVTGSLVFSCFVAVSWSPWRLIGFYKLSLNRQSTTDR